MPEGLCPVGWEARRINLGLHSEVVQRIREVMRGGRKVPEVKTDPAANAERKGAGRGVLEELVAEATEETRVDHLLLPAVPAACLVAQSFAL
jgi:Mn-dependent DtxR family transcriptional regulator